jgi:hypothetical protein
MKKFWLELHVQTYFSQAEDKVMNVTKLISHYLDLISTNFWMDMFIFWP